MFRIFLCVLAVLAAANAAVLPNPVLETTITGESGTIREERTLPYVPLVFGTRSVFPLYQYPVVPIVPVDSVVPEETPVVEAKSGDQSKDSEHEETPEVKTTVKSGSVVVLPEHVAPFYGYYPYYGLNSYYYRFF